MLPKQPIQNATSNVSVSGDTVSGENPLFLHRTEKGLQLKQGNMILRNDFSDMLPRITPGKLQAELLVKAAKIKNKKSRNSSAIQNENNTLSTSSPKENPQNSNHLSLIAIDATAGLGQDSFLLAAAGFTVHMYEQDPIIAALLEDALDRAKQDPALAPIVSRMHLHKENSVRALEALANSLSKATSLDEALLANKTDDATDQGEPENSIEADGLLEIDGIPKPREAAELHRKPEVIYLDPMFPERTKSASVKKKFQLLHLLEHPCENEEELLEAAIALHPKKVIVKRMAKGPFLAGKKPSYSIKGKSIRYDCYVFA